MPEKHTPIDHHTDRVIWAVRQERARQNDRWGEQNHSPLEWIAILGEEFGEAAKEAIDHHHGAQDTLDDYRAELVQTAAVAIAAIEALDRRRSRERIPA